MSLPNFEMSQRLDRRRTVTSDFIRLTTYPVTASSMIWDLINMPTFGNGAAGALRGIADLTLLTGVGLGTYVYGSKLRSARLDADGRYYATPLWEPGKMKGRIMDYGAYGLIGAGSTSLWFSVLAQGQLRWSDLGTALGSLSLTGRAGFGWIQMGVAQTERHGPRWIENHPKLFAASDALVTWAQSGAVVGSAAYYVFTLL
jgi:hypothetical protein